jgi:hypothetical protein
MNENQLLKLWNDQRSARIRSQLAPTILLSVVLALTSTNHLSRDSDAYLRLFTIGIVSASGIFSLFSTFSSVRDGISVIRSLEEIKGLSPFGKDIRDSIGSLVFSGFTFAIFALFNFAALYFCLYKK